MVQLAEKAEGGREEEYSQRIGIWVEQERGFSPTSNVMRFVSVEPVNFLLVNWLLTPHSFSPCGC